MKFVIVGLGRMGLIHLEAARSLGWSCIAAVDPKPSEEAFSLLPAGVPLFSKYGPDVSLLMPEAVVLAATTDVRTKLLLEVMKDTSVELVVTEKPLSNSIEHAREVLTVAKTLRKRVVVNHQMRFTPLYKFISNLVATRRYGDLVSMHVSGSNFGLGNNVVHFVEIATYLFDSEPRDVRGQIEETPLGSHRGKQFKDYSGRLEANFPGNRILTVDFVSALGHGVLTVLGFSYAKVVVNELSGDVTVIARRDDDFAIDTQRYGLPGITESLNFGAVDLLEGTAMLYESSKDSNVAMAGLERAVSAVEVASLAVHSAWQNGGQPVAYETSATPNSMKINHNWP